MKTRIKNTIGGILIFVGLFVAVCTVDGSENEMRNRLIGVAMCAVGTTVIEGDKQEKEEREERKVDHESYPEE